MSSAIPSKSRVIMSSTLLEKVLTASIISVKVKNKVLKSWKKKVKNKPKIKRRETSSQLFVNNIRALKKHFLNNYFILKNILEYRFVAKN